ncbi:hypothetical protein CGC49_08460 [Capnocytophaga sp. H4358]|uniref:6-bladed beta-propeller n=2 Tax=Capnocytophaga TaxID=1016 RepID=UPI000BB1AFD6|nr:6-bladed beta-propeller [Capnocytophaga canis]ATA73302.1 hypothetical protein CGC49_08460 [Capnocytophaga sp. H4358]
MKHSILFCLLMSFFIFGCKKKEDRKEFCKILIDFDKIENVDLSQHIERKVCFEFSEESMLGNLDEIVLNGQGFLIRSLSNLFLFDEQGRFLSQIGSKGAAPDEYSNFNSFFIKGDDVFIYDDQTKRMIIYDFQGRYKSTINLNDRYDSITPNFIYPLSDGKFISKNMYGGSHRKTPSYSILKEDYSIEKNIKNRWLAHSFFSLNNFNVGDGKNMLFWEILNDTIFTITEKQECFPKYIVDFQEKSIPSDVKKKEFYELIQFTNQPENINKYASLVQNVYEDSDFLRFTFLFQRKIHYVKHDRNNNKTKVYLLTYDNQNLGSRILFHKNHLYVPVNDLDSIESNGCLILIDESKL